MEIPVSRGILALGMVPANSLEQNSLIADMEQTLHGSVRPTVIEQQKAFNNTLLTIINDLLQGQGKGQIPQVVADIAPSDGHDKADVKLPELSTDMWATPQQMLDGLLLASQQPITPLTMNSMPLQMSERQMTEQSSSGNHGSASLVLTSQSASGLHVTLPVANPIAQPITVMSKGMQSAMQKPLMPTFNEGGGALSATIPRQITTVVSHDKTASFETQLATVKLDGGVDRWGHQLQTALGERLQVQMKSQLQHATIRLDPPDMGKIDISMQIENGRMHVHINASQGEVYRALQLVSHDLRQTLTEQNFAQVDVQVSSQSGQQQGGKDQLFFAFPPAMPAANEIQDDSQQTGYREDDSVLLTV